MIFSVLLECLIAPPLGSFPAVLFDTNVEPTISKLPTLEIAPPSSAEFVPFTLLFVNFVKLKTAEAAVSSRKLTAPPFATELFALNREFVTFNAPPTIIAPPSEFVLLESKTLPEIFKA